MKLTWTFYPKHTDGLSVTLTVIYVPELDVEKLASGGFLTPNNVAYVDWPTYRLFDQSDIKARQHAFGSLVRVTDADAVRKPNGAIILLPAP